MVTAKKSPRRTRKQRARMAAIRAVWAFLLPGIGFAVEYLADIDRLREIGLAVPLALGIGAALYAAKRYWWPDTTW